MVVVQIFGFKGVIGRILEDKDLLGPSGPGPQFFPVLSKNLGVTEYEDSSTPLNLECIMEKKRTKCQ